MIDPETRVSIIRTTLMMGELWRQKVASMLGDVAQTPPELTRADQVGPWVDGLIAAGRGEQLLTVVEAADTLRRAILHDIALVGYMVMEARRRGLRPQYADLIAALEAPESHWIDLGPPPPPEGEGSADGAAPYRIDLSDIGRG